jgi:hypothetical protein
MVRDFLIGTLAFVVGVTLLSSALETCAPWVFRIPG